VSSIIESIDVEAPVSRAYNQWTQFGAMSGCRGARTRDPTIADRTGVLNARIKGDLKKFKQFIESRDGRETGAWRGNVDRPGAGPN
jgi:hypothetical protein